MTPYQRYAKLLRGATPAEWVAAARWYDNARNIASQMQAINPALTLDRAAGIIAALSPRLHWSRNVRSALAYAAGRRDLGLLRRSMTAAERAERGEMPTGPKTNAFARAIAGDLDAVVIDAWMYRAAGLTGKRRSDCNTCADAVNRLATQYRIPPAVIQAAVWIKARGRVE